MWAFIDEATIAKPKKSWSVQWDSREILQVLRMKCRSDIPHSESQWTIFLHCICISILNFKLNIILHIYRPPAGPRKLKPEQDQPLQAGSKTSFKPCCLIVTNGTFPLVKLKKKYLPRIYFSGADSCWVFLQYLAVSNIHFANKFDSY